MAGSGQRLAQPYTGRSPTRAMRQEAAMYLLGSMSSPDDRHVYVVYLSRAGLTLAAGGSVVEAEPSPASAAARLAGRHLRKRLFPPGRRGGRSLIQVSEISSLREGLTTWPDMGDIAGRYESLVLVTPVLGGRLPAVVAEALTRLGPHALTGVTALPVITLADSTGEPGDALLGTSARRFPARRSGRRSSFSARLRRRWRPCSRPAWTTSSNSSAFGDCPKARSARIAAHSGRLTSAAKTPGSLARLRNPPYLSTTAATRFMPRPWLPRFSVM